MRTSSGRPRKAELERWDAFMRVGCVACYLWHRYSVPEVHHLLSGTRRRGHRYTIPLCPAHHRGVGHDESVHGPSLATRPRLFREVFGSDWELLTLADVLIEDGRDRRELNQSERSEVRHGS